jgi:hypothetical protein
MLNIPETQLAPSRGLYDSHELRAKNSERTARDGALTSNVRRFEKHRTDDCALEPVHPGVCSKYGP